MASPLATSDKLVLLLSLVPYVLDQGEVSVSEAAAHFDVAPERVREAMSLIAVSGVPGETKAYLDNDLFDIDWDAFDQDLLIITHRVALEDSPRLSAREAAALIAGLQYLAALPGNSANDAIDALQAKLARGAGGGVQPVAIARPVIDQSLKMIQDALERGVQVEFDYMNSRGDRERRAVDPLRIESRDTDWYLKGWCHLREAVRTFRLDRITGLTVTDRPLSARAESLALPEALFQPSADDLQVEVSIASGAEPFFVEYLGERLGETAQGAARYRIRVAHFHGLKRLVTGNPGLIEVLAPEEARQAVADWARAGIRAGLGETTAVSSPEEGAAEEASASPLDAPGVD